MSGLDAANDELAEQLRQRIRRDGPISFYDWMKAALYHPRLGYYCRPGTLRQGRAGDYRTAPETSTLFAATFARYFSKLYLELDSPREWTIVEAGTGRGDFAHGLLHSLQLNHPAIFAATQYVIDEINPDRQTVKDRLADFAERVQFGSFPEITKPFETAIIFSNELFDAFPVHRVIGRDGNLREFFVGLDDGNNFVWTEGEPRPSVREYCERTGLNLSEGQIFEISLHVEPFICRAAALMKRGFLITVDYGAERAELVSAPHRFAGTLRAFYKHQLLDDVFAQPGRQDLTTTVDWTEMQEAGRRYGLVTRRLEQLDRFLLAEGVLDELANAGRDRTAAGLVNLNLGAREMIMPHGLAASFQVLVQTKDESVPPA
jgi:SAM-dependent MidA family methyltransferase